MTHCGHDASQFVAGDEGTSYCPACEADARLIVRLTLVGEPVPKGRPKVGHGRGYTPKRTAFAEDAIRWQLKSAGVRRPIPEADVEVTLRFFLSTHRRVDVDNLAKLVLDACNGLLWADDSQVAGLSARRELGAAIARTELSVSLV